MVVDHYYPLGRRRFICVTFVSGRDKEVEQR